VALLYAPLYALDGLTVAAGWLPEEAADKLFGLIGVMVMPFANATLLSQAHAWSEGRKRRSPRRCARHARLGADSSPSTSP
jgi:hypothetical protein